MPRMCRFSSPTRVGIISVNPLSVRYLRPGSHDTTTIYFDSGHTLTVNSPLSEVERAIDLALNNHEL